MQIIVTNKYISDWKYFTAQNTKLIHALRVRLYWSKSDDIASKRIHRESNLVFTLSSNKDEEKKSLSRSFSVN